MKMSPSYGVLTLGALVVLLATVYPATSQSLDVQLKKAQRDIETLRHTIANLAKQTMSQQLFLEERIRSSGSSGIKVTRTRMLGNKNYHASTHVSGGVAAIHDHANHRHAVGMGETVVVLNGVEFRTRHNDYKVMRPSPTNRTYGAMEYIDTPDVPPEVLRKRNIEDQMQEMREWFKAFHFQDHSVRDYRKYFKPVLCYLEGAWTLDKELNEPFESDRHELVASSWDELQQQIRYTSFTGTKDLNENFSFLPTSIMGVDPVTGKPKYAQWNYRILCNPISQDIPTKWFRQQDDLAYRAPTGKTQDKVLKSRAARFRLSKIAFDKFINGANSILDEIMKEIPGKDNVPNLLNEEPFGLPIYDTRYSNNTLLNTGYYHRSFKTSKNGAMGLSNIYRGFNDEFLFVAETTQPNIAKESFRYCKNKRTCVTKSTSFTYAIPLEVIYLTPLTKWNPYNLPLYDKDTVMKGKRRGQMFPDKAFNGTSEKVNFYRTPAEFYASSQPDVIDPADTTMFGVGVLDRNGNVRRMAGAGTRTLTLPIEGAGRIRLRYPIMPVHAEGSTVGKEMTVIKQMVAEGEALTGKPPASSRYLIVLRPTSVSGMHQHSFYLSFDEWEKIQAGEIISVTTELANGHDHDLQVWRNPKNQKLEYKSCGGQIYCWDKHPRRLLVKEKPGGKKRKRFV